MTTGSGAGRRARSVLAAEAVARGRQHATDVWYRGGPRSRRPRFTLEDIARAAVDVADREGLQGLSMRNLASALGAGTMTLYHYVRTKAELLALVTDHVMGEVVVPDDEELPADWREALTLVAHRSRDSMRRHPWLLDVTDDPPIGPNGARHFDQTLQAVSSLDVTMQERVELVLAVDEYTFGYCLMERNNNYEEILEVKPEMRDYLQSLIDGGGYPQLEALTNRMGLEKAWTEISSFMRAPGRFDRNLVRLLDGFEAGFARSRRSGRPRSRSRG